MELTGSLVRGSHVNKLIARLREIAPDVPVAARSEFCELESPLEQLLYLRACQALHGYDCARVWVPYCGSGVEIWAYQVGMLRKVGGARNALNGYEFDAVGRATDRLAAGRPLWPQQHLQLHAIVDSLLCAGQAEHFPKSSAEHLVRRALVAGFPLREVCDWEAGLELLPLPVEVADAHPDPWRALERAAESVLGHQLFMREDVTHPWLLRPQPRDVNGEVVHAAVA